MESGSPTSAKLLPDMSQAIFFLAVRSPSSNRRQDPAAVPGQLPCLSGEGSMAGPTALTCHSSKTLGDRPQDKVDKMNSMTSEATLTKDVRSAWRSIFSADTGQTGVWDVGAQRACVEKRGDFINK